MHAETPQTRVFGRRRLFSNENRSASATRFSSVGPSSTFALRVSRSPFSRASFAAGGHLASPGCSDSPRLPCASLSKSLRRPRHHGNPPLLHSRPAGTRQVSLGCRCLLLTFVCLSSVSASLTNHADSTWGGPSVSETHLPTFSSPPVPSLVPESRLRAAPSSLLPPPCSGVRTPQYAFLPRSPSLPASGWCCFDGAYSSRDASFLNTSSAVSSRYQFSTLSSLSSALPLFSSSSRVSSALPCAAFSSLRSPASRLCGGASLPSFWRPSPPSGGVFSPAPSAQPRRPAIPSRETALWGFTIFVNPDTAPDNKDLIVGTYNRMCISQGHIRRIRENRRRVKRVTRGEGGSFAVLKRRKERYWEMRKTRETARRVLWTDIGKLRYGQLRRLIEALHTNVTLEERKLRQETGEQAPPSAREAAAPLSRTGSP